MRVQVLNHEVISEYAYFLLSRWPIPWFHHHRLHVSYPVYLLCREKLAWRWRFGRVAFWCRCAGVLVSDYTTELLVVLRPCSLQHIMLLCV